MTPIKTLLPATALSVLTSMAFAGNEFTEPLSSVANETIASWVVDPAIVAAVQAQNTVTSEYSQDRILELDTTWRAETVSGGALIESVLGNALSAHLKQLKSEGHGQFTEIFVTDSRGLNVGQSDVTSDYWQGDEAKWQVPTETMSAHIGDIEFDESTQTYQSQVSLPIMSDGAVIGVITVGVDVQRIASN